MPNKILIYSSIYNFVAEQIVREINDINEDEDIDYLVNTPGGGVFAGWSIIGPINERTGKNNAKVFGEASSMGFYTLLFMDHVEALDVSVFRVHRADGPTSDDQEIELLASVNKKLRAKLEAKIDVKIFKEITGVTIKQLFDPEKRINVDLNADQAKKIGLVDKVVPLGTKKLAAFNKEKIAAISTYFDEPKPEPKAEKKPKINDEIMDINELKSKHPNIYAEAEEAGKKIGVDKENNRVKAWMVWNHVDAEKVKAGIDSGKDITAVESQEFIIAMNDPKKLEALKKGKPGETKTPNAEKTAEELEIKAEEDALHAELGINQKKED